MKILQRFLSVLCLSLAAMLVYRHFELRTRRSKEVTVADWHRLPQGPAGTLARDLRNSACLWFDGKEWKVVSGTCSEILELRLKVILGTESPKGDVEPLVTVGPAVAADLIGLVRRADGQVQVGVEIWGREFMLGKPFKPAQQAFYLDAVVDGINNLVRVYDRDALVFETRTKPWPASTFVIGTNPYGGSHVSGNFSGSVVSVPTSRSQPVGGGGGDTGREVHYPRGSVYLKVEFGTARFRRGQPLLVTGANGRADIFSVTVESLGHLHFTFDHWGVGGPASPSIAFDPSVAHVIAIRSGGLPRVANSTLPADKSYSVLFDGREVLRGNASFYPATSDELFIAENPVGGSSCDPTFSDSIIERGISL